MIECVGRPTVEECQISFGTHSGIFHCDEVVGIAILEMAHMHLNAFLLRSRNPAELDELDIVIDVGGGIFDHHMKGFNDCRPTGEKYASAGLVWKEFGKKAIEIVMDMMGVSIDDCEIQRIKEEIDREIIIPVDMEDNGVEGRLHTFSFVSKYLPSWMETPNYDQTFMNAEEVVFSILYEIIKSKIDKVATTMELNERFDQVEDGILEIPAQTMPWTESVVAFNESHDNTIKFVVFPYPSGGWAAQCVPPSVERKFEQLVSFPSEWAGGNESTLPDISGVEDATFCHNGCFFARARTKEAIFQMCRLAMR